jgi:hypothetical protein
MKSMTLAMGLLCAMPLIGLGESSPVRNAAKTDAPQSATSRPTDTEAVRRRPGDRGKDFKPTEQQIADAEAFIEKHSPNRFRAYKRMKEIGSGPHMNLKRWIAGNHLALKAVENADPELYAMKLDELRLEDDIFGVVDAAREKGTFDKEKIRQETRPMMKELVAKRKEQAAHRIERMKAALAAEQKQLDEMNASSDQWIDKRLNEELSRGGRLVPPLAGRREVNGPTTAEN